MMSRISITPALGRLAGRGLLAGALVFAHATLVSPGTFTAYGPRVFTRSTGEPVTVRDTFNVLNPATQYSLRIRVDRVSSAVVSLNGVQIAGPSDFNPKVTLIEKPVVVRTSNELAVEVRGQPGGTLTIDVFGIDNQPPTITASKSPPPNAQGWNNTPVTVRFTCTDALSGIASCTPDQVVSREGANQTVTGTATDRAGNTATATSAPFSIDLTPPSITVVLKGQFSNGVYTPPVTAQFTCADKLSGVASCPAEQIFKTPGPNQVATGTATDIAGNSASVKSEPFTIVDTGPVITDFNPKTARAGTLINVVGSGLLPTGGVPIVTLSMQGGGTIEAPLSSATATSLAFVVPTGAATGPITVRVGNQTAASTTPLTIAPFSDFTLTAAPSAADLIEGQSTAFAVTIASANGFSLLADLTVAGVPAGITASFAPPRITAGQTSVLTVRAPLGQSTGSAVLSISGTATVDGIRVAQTADVTLRIGRPTTSFVGRTVVDDAPQTPLAGVTVTMLGKNGEGGTTGCTGTTRSDAAGNFALTNLGPACVGPQLVGYDGLTATSPEGDYAGVNLVYTLQAGQVTASPVLVHLPRIDDKETAFVRQNAPQDQTYAYRTIPGLSVTVYRGTTFRLPDGSTPDPFPLVAVQVPVDRLPDAKPPVPTMFSAFIVAFQPANAVASQPAAVFYPNTLNTPPGTNMTLMTLDPTRGRMVPYGTATVSPGATQIIPDLDPAFPGHRYGIVNFDWHGPMPPTTPPPPNPDPRPPVSPGPGNGGCDPGDGASEGGGGCATGSVCEGASCDGANPVDLSSGLETVIRTDIAFGGTRGRISIKRIYRTLSTFAGPFGIGTHHNYGYRLDTLNPQAAQAIDLATPDGNRFPFSREKLEGCNTDVKDALINCTIPAMQGARMTVLADEVRLRWKDGTVYRFVQPNPQFTPQLESITDANGNRTTITRNPNNANQVTQVTDPVGRSLVLTYDGANRVTSITDPIGRVVRYTYNAQGTLETVTDPEGGVTRYEYDAQNRMVRETNARGVVVTANTYDANGRVSRQVQADGGIFDFEYTLLNPTVGTSPVLATTVTDPLGRKTTHRFNPVGFLTDRRTVDEQLYVVRRTAGTNRIGDVRIVGTDAGKANYEYDANGNVVRWIDALGNSTTYTYEPVFHKVASIANVLGDTTRFTYDSRGNQITRTDANGHVTSYTYVTNGLLTEITDALGHKTRLAYNVFGNLVASTDAGGNVTHFSYDGVSRLIEMMDSLGRRARTQYDRLDRVTQQVDGKGQTTTFSYDAVGNLTSVRDARGKTTRFAYDALNRLTTRTDPVGKSDSRTYDSRGNLVSFTDRRGHTNTFRYDERNRLIAERYQDGSSVSRVYDALGRLSNVQDSPGGFVPAVAFVYEYDLAGRLLRAPGRFGTVLYERDALGRVTTRQVTGQLPVRYTYDPVGNLLSAAMSQASVTYTYDAARRPVTLNRLNGVSTQHTYDSVGRLLTLTHARGTTVLNSQVYTYDLAGNRISQQTNVAQPLITSPAAATYDDANRLVQRGSTTYAYDDNGNLISETGPTGATTYTWDSRNRLQRVFTANGQTTSYTYDFAGNLISQRDTGPAINSTRTFVVDEIANVLYQSRSDGDNVSILTGQFIDSHLATAGSTGQIEYGLVDAINSTVATVDQTGAVVGQFSYEPFGETLGSGSRYPFQYTGRVPASSSIYHYRARFYSTSISRFISEDTFVSSNLYSYGRNSPINFIDPSGHVWVSDSERQDIIVSQFSRCQQRGGTVEACIDEAWNFYETFYPPITVDEVTLMDWWRAFIDSLRQSGDVIVDVLQLWIFCRYGVSAVDPWYPYPPIPNSRADLRRQIMRRGSI